MGHDSIALPSVRGPAYDLEDAKAKIQRVFRYLLELHRVKTPPTVHMSNYEWILKLGALPNHPSIQRGMYWGSGGLLPGESSGDEGGDVLKVGRPQETECPQPSVIIQNWLRPGWDRAGVEPAVYTRRKIKTDSEQRVPERFEDSEERVDAFTEWLGRRQAWERQERGVVDSLDFFSDLFELSGKFAREAEKYQLYLADGVLVMDHPGGEVRHPLLLQRLQLDFNPLVPEFTLRETAENPEIYSPLLRYLGVDGKELLRVKETLAEHHYHPLDHDPTSEFFRDMVHRFWQDGQFFESPDLVDHAAGPYVYRQPLLMLGHRYHGFSETLERYVEAVDGFAELPESLLRIVGIDTGRAADGEEEATAPIDLLLTKDANPEQERVLRRLEETGAVLVQGPPGTGKSHTIANLIGHLLAQKKTILVTSHASKALRVVREKVVEPLQALCVSLLDSDDESSKQLEESITGIVNYLSTTSEKKLEKASEKLAEKRSALRREYEQLRQALLGAIAGEYREVEIAGESKSPAAMARTLHEYRGHHDWIPGPVGPGTELPLTPEEVEELYALNGTLSREDESILSAPLPDPEQLPGPKDFAALFDEIAKVEATNLKIGSEYWLHEHQRPGALAELVAAIKAAARVFEVEEEWVFDCVEAGRKGKEEKEAWQGLVRVIESCVEVIPGKEELILEHGPKVKANKPAKELIRICDDIVKHLESGKKLGRTTPVIHPEWYDLIRCTTVDEGEPERLAHFHAIRNLLEVQTLREDLQRRWDRQMEALDAPKLGAKPEKKAQQWVAHMLLALDWYEETWSNCRRALQQAGFDWERFLQETPAQPRKYGDLLVLKTLLLEKLVPVVETRARRRQLRNLEQQRDDWLEYLGGLPKKDASYRVTKLFLNGIKKKNFDSYSHAWKRLHDLIGLKPPYERRWELLKKLEPEAQMWAHAIYERRPPHDASELPGDLLKAWRNRHWEQCLDRLHEDDLEALQNKLSSVKEQLQKATASYVEKLAWSAQLRRTGLPQQQALNGWLALHKKMGRGTGKRVAHLKQEAKKILVECRQAVPVWIMPLSRVVESFDVATTRFDVVILDEASQNDVTGLVALAMAKEAVVVGDHEQVSPYAVGHNAEKIQGLIDEILEEIPNRQLYDGKTSVYDLARQSFGGTIRLLEHFRCVPEIIQFSNFLCYAGEIRALREASASKLEPHLVSRRVKGTAENKINEKEALEVASIVSAMCRLPEYEESTIGVISMVGTEQALYVDSILRRRLSVAEYQRRRLLCGNASQFQGDERDVIVLSMVDSPQGHPLTLRRRDEAKKVFNVAASRARDQLWVVHSLDPGRDLKAGDLRLQLIAHVEDLASLQQREATTSPERFASPFEQKIFEDLTEAGYRTYLHWPVGDLTVDIVVEGSGGKRVALLCEGDRHEPPEELTETMERQVILERLGWKFFRLRASEFFRDPDASLKKLFRRLKGAGLDRLGPVDAAEPAQSDAESLEERVLRRAEMIRGRWQERLGKASGRKRGRRRKNASSEADGEGE
ncbi:MAG: AAA domain-containing protein [Planctomycetota bacterium]|jgi:very-short-patch-repair endonuclease